MAETQTVRRRATGLYTHPNALEVPPGSLLVADNAVIDREWVISKRRGVKRYGQALDGSALALFEFKRRLVLLDGDRLKYDSDGLGTWVSWAGNYLQPSDTTRIRPVETNGCIFIPTYIGVFRNDSLTGTPRRAGTPEAIDYTLSFIGTGGLSSFLPIDSAVGYRILWGRKDAEGNVLTGTPSHQERAVNVISDPMACGLAGGVVSVTMTGHGFTTGDTIEIFDPSDPALEAGEHTPITVIDPDLFTYTVSDLITVLVGAAVSVGKRRNIRLTFRVPPGIVAGDFYEVYRTTPVTVTADVEVGETYKRVRQVPYVSGTTLTFDDTFGDDRLDLPLYTNGGEEGPSQTNDRPPFCRYVAFYKTHTFYAYAQREQSLEILFNQVTLVANGDTITINAGTPLVYTFAAAENQAARQFKLSAVSATLTEAEAVALTMKSFQKIVNGDSQSNVLVYYTSGSDDAPGRVEIRAKELQSTPFTVSAVIGGGSGIFTPQIESTPETSTADLLENSVYRSKSGQPDHVPALNRHLIGRKNKRILGMFANRDALFVLKEDGLFTISGESDGGAGFGFIVDERDPTIILKALNSLVGLDNSLYAFTSQDGTRITQSTSSVISRQVEIDFKELEALGRFEEDTYGIAYESDRKYLLIVPGDAVWVFNYLTNAWTRWLLPVSLGWVLTENDRVYWAHSREPYILEERKDLSFDGRDQQDEDLDVTVTAFTTGHFGDEVVSLVTVTHTYFQPPEEGWYFSQGQSDARVEAVTDLGGGSFRLTLSKNLNVLVMGAAVLSMPVRLRVVWAPETAGSAATIKQFPGLQIYPENNAARHNVLAFLADTQSAFEYVNTIVVENTTGWGLKPWGSFPWGSPRRGRSQPIRTIVPQDHQRCRALMLLYENFEAREQVNILEAAYDVRPFGTRTERQPD